MGALMTMKPITLQVLKDHNACLGQVELFERFFGSEVIPTRELALKHARDFDWHWAASTLLSPKSWMAYKEATAPALKAYREAVAPALKAYDEAEALALKAYKEATDPALKAYDEATALAFLEQWEKH